MSRLTRDGTAEPVSRDQILTHARGQGNIHFPCSADYEQDWQPYPVDPYSAICDDHTYIHTYITAQSVPVMLVMNASNPQIGTTCMVVREKYIILVQYIYVHGGPPISYCYFFFVYKARGDHFLQFSFSENRRFRCVQIFL